MIHFLRSEYTHKEQFNLYNTSDFILLFQKQLPEIYTSSGSLRKLKFKKNKK